RRKEDAQVQHISVGDAGCGHIGLILSVAEIPPMDQMTIACDLITQHGARVIGRAAAVVRPPSDQPPSACGLCGAFCGGLAGNQDEEKQCRNKPAEKLIQLPHPLSHARRPDPPCISLSSLSSTLKAACAKLAAGASSPHKTTGGGMP